MRRPRSSFALTFFISWTIFLNLSNKVSSVKLSPNGGYSVVVAINENFPAPSDDGSDRYVQNIREIFHRFSIRLWQASRGTFFIQDLNLIIPTSWEIRSGTKIGVATTESYHNSDVRISEEFLRPRVENPNPCGRSGQFIEIPLSFFENVVTGNYGPPAAALMNQWARYRYGVFEEHGYPSETQFPYFYKKPNGSSWVMNGCSDQPITGKYLDSFNDVCDTETLDVQPNPDCRLRPDGKNTALTSYMQFHWLDSVNEFCDEENHNGESPNRQNLFCGHRSIWEVLRGTSDFKSVVKPLDLNSGGVPALKLNVVKLSGKPRLYILLDEGRTSVKAYVLEDLFSNITSFFTGSLEEDTVAAIGIYPNTNIGCETESVYVSQKVPWNTISSARDSFISFLNAGSLRNGQVIRDFGRAILEIIQDINSQRFAAGAVILVVKTGVGENTFGQLTYEQDVVAGLLEFANIRIYAAELGLGINEGKASKNLETLALTSGGKHVTISKSYDIRTKFVPVMNEIVQILGQPIQNMNTDRLEFVTLHRGYVLPDTQIEIPILVSDLNLVEFHLTTAEALKAFEIVLTSDANPSVRNVMTSRFEWGEDTDRKKRMTYSLRTSAHISENTTWTLIYPCMREISDCRGHLIVYGLQAKKHSGSSDQDVDILVSTSAENNVVDMSLFNDFGPVQAPFSVFAKVTQGRHPVRNLIVTAHIQIPDGSENWTIQLSDDGKLTPDISTHDGIYSGNFIPPKDNLYQISVSVQTTRNTVIENENPEVISNSVLLPVDQKDMECTAKYPECTSVTLMDGFQKIVNFQNVIRVVNTVTFVPGKPFRITDFKVITASNYVVNFVFTAPELIGSSTGGADQFDFYYSARLKNLVGTVDGNGRTGMMRGAPPGETVTFRYAAMSEVTVYYAVEAIALSGSSLLRSGPSNIVGVKTVLWANDSTTPTTTEVTEITQTTPIFTTTRIPTLPTTTRDPIPPTTTRNPALPTTTRDPTTTKYHETTSAIIPTKTTPGPIASSSKNGIIVDVIVLTAVSTLLILLG